MRQIVIQNLIIERFNAAGSTNTLSKGTAKAFAHYISGLGVSDETISNLIIPRLVTHIAGLKTAVNKFEYKPFINTLIADAHIVVAQAPQRARKDVSLAQRRIDSLSRILAVQDSISPCSAVLLHEGKFVISSNFPRIEGANEEEMVENFHKMMSDRVGILQQFIRTIEANHSEVHIQPAKDFQSDKSESDEYEIVFNMKAHALAALTARQLGGEQVGGHGNVLPEHKSKYVSPREHLQNALLKVASAYLLAKYYDTYAGFTKEQANALMSPNFVLLVRSKELGKGNWHAEQLQADYLLENHLLKGQPIHIGISKLCCQACDTVLSHYKDIQYRGTHGVNFPGVYDMVNEDVHRGVVTKMSTHLCASDSDSEVDLSSSNHSLTSSVELSVSSDSLMIEPVKPLSLKRSVESLNESGYCFFSVKRCSAYQSKRLTVSQDDVSTTAPISA
ncbi:hypothetical protein Lbir_2457 [Legionella birminghamensis]|uniref:Uncharacterized protein n=1 Tax=Legionella birminghamensis TaxID=28083 RepID=A0A378I9M0_9GAMM|nr:nucleic acid/nucleotide deaminase domain-containing protein [Legionella birminghamensis]KTC68924.1 hypothetical protein Lbir_2457 [Legionella birminghamensis]STX31440.1 Uncharacterised protein [Legionella birminghamensis]